MLRLKACGLSDVGMLRSHNEDCFEIDPDYQIAVVADGDGRPQPRRDRLAYRRPGIHEFAADRRPRHHLAFVYDARLHGIPIASSQRAMAHDRVLRAIRQDGSLHAWAHVVGILLAGNVLAGHVRRRAYRFATANGAAHQDHTWVNEQVVAGYLTDEQAAPSSQERGDRALA